MKGCLRNQVGDSFFRLNYNLPFYFILFLCSACLCFLARYALKRQSFYPFPILSQNILERKVGEDAGALLSIRMNSCAEFFM